MERKPYVLAVSGVKNSGKTTLITRIVPVLSSYGLKVATIKHDGHDFEADVPGTDTWQHMAAGAYGTAIFSSQKYMVVKQQKNTLPEQLIECFPEADIILLEGFKYSDFPKIEVIRKESSDESVCQGHHLIGIVSDLTKEELKSSIKEVPVFDINDEKAVSEFILDLLKQKQ